jgi:hypothetical protein
MQANAIRQVLQDNIADVESRLRTAEKDLEAARKERADDTAVMERLKSNLDMNKAELEGLKHVLKERDDEKARGEDWRKESDKRERDSLVEVTRLNVLLEEMERNLKQQVQIAEREMDAMNARLEQYENELAESKHAFKKLKKENKKLIHKLGDLGAAGNNHAVVRPHFYLRSVCYDSLCHMSEHLRIYVHVNVNWETSTLQAIAIDGAMHTSFSFALFVMILCDVSTPTRVCMYHT